MFDPISFQNTVSGQRHDFAGVFARCFLAGLELPYSAGVAINNFLYENHWKTIRRLPVPVISIGNLTLGGTGKTPFVAWLTRYLLEQGHNPGIASRGYHADEAGWNDEARELALAFPETPQAISPARYFAAIKMLESAKKNGKQVDVILLDDGFQHRKLHRDLDIILLDALEPFGYDRIFPRGMLREPISSLSRADIVLLSRANLISDEKKEKIRKKVLNIARNLLWGEIQQIPATLVSMDGEKLPVESLQNRRILAFCGIGNPGGFQKMLESLHLNVVDFLTFPDHFHYTGSQICRILDLAQKTSTNTIVCTVKDLVKLRKLKISDFSPLAIMIDIKMTENEAGVLQKINDLARFHH